jgi:hypothetical protein
MSKHWRRSRLKRNCRLEVGLGALLNVYRYVDLGLVVLLCIGHSSVWNVDQYPTFCLVRCLVSSCKLCFLSLFKNLSCYGILSL